jgi:hypothetical protein
MLLTIAFQALKEHYQSRGYGIVVDVLSPSLLVVNLAVIISIIPLKEHVLIQNRHITNMGKPKLASQ